MTEAELSEIYRDCIACLNTQDWPRLGQFIDGEVYYNNRQVGIQKYREIFDLRPTPRTGCSSESPSAAGVRLRRDCRSTP